jgi:hypothetical protein
MARDRHDETRTESWFGNLREIEHSEDPGADRRVT